MPALNKLLKPPLSDLSRAISCCMAEVSGSFASAPKNIV
jgi:hypothetical protein